jgi:hypothetical protein
LDGLERLKPYVYNVLESSERLRGVKKRCVFNGLELFRWPRKALTLRS